MPSSAQSPAQSPWGLSGPYWAQQLVLTEHVAYRLALGNFGPDFSPPEPAPHEPNGSCIQPLWPVQRVCVYRPAVALVTHIRADHVFPARPPHQLLTELHRASFCPEQGPICTGGHRPPGRQATQTQMPVAREAGQAKKNHITL